MKQFLMSLAALVAVAVMAVVVGAVVDGPNRDVVATMAMLPAMLVLSLAWRVHARRAVSAHARLVDEVAERQRSTPLPDPADQPPGHAPAPGRHLSGAASADTPSA
jgi:ABC-type transport system involved in cytochrome bd biosynthesis fused ATPase/permease subunit